MTPTHRSPPADSPATENVRTSDRWHTDERQSAVMATSARVDSPHPTIIADDQGNVISLNAFAALMLQRQDENVRGWRVVDLLGFDMGESPLIPDESLLPGPDANAAKSTFSEFARRSDGSTFPVEVTCARLHCQAERFTIIHFCDVSARQATETRLRQLSSALEQIADHAVITDADGTILYVNRAFEDVTGYARTTAIGQSMNLVKSGKHEAEFYAQLWAALRSGSVYRAEFINRNARGDLYIDEQSISPFVDDASGAMYYIATGRDVTERRLRDPLTGLPSRAALVDRIAQAATRRARDPNSHQFALAFIDLDRFQNVNDAHGMVAGDQVLVEVGNRIRLAVRKADAVAQVSHLDRDEFAVILEEIHGIEDVRRVAQRLLEAIREPITLGDGTTIVVTASIGIASPGEGEVSPESLLQDAETAMRRAKTTPDDPCQVLDPAMHARARDRLRLESELRAAIQRDEFVLHYQPIVSLTTGYITSCEALVRWIHPTRGFVPPLDFIGIAEETGLIVPLGRLVLEKACRQACLWQAAKLGTISVAVNVAARQLSEGHLVETVRQTLEATGLPPRLLKIELTESAAANNPDAVIAVLQKLRALGIELLIDDFGTGFSSLSRLTRFPLHKLKIDRSFVANLPNNGHDSTVASTIVAMAHSLGLGVIAEGVETADQAEFLRFIGCEEMQGFLFSKPVDAETFERLLREGKRMPIEQR
jgi:diguanylate cyclase (GGDEF)-like protein/PAS domain S-box-containing protein